MVIEAIVGVPLITPVVEFNVRPGPGDWFVPTIDQTKGGVPAAAANVTLNGTLTVPFIGEPVVIVNTVGPEAGAGAGAGAVETSLQPLKPNVAAKKSTIIRKRLRLGFQHCATMIPLFPISRHLVIIIIRETHGQDLLLRMEGKYGEIGQGSGLEGAGHSRCHKSERL